MSKKITIVIIAVVVVAVGILAYVFLNNSEREEFRRPPFGDIPNNFSISEEIKTSTVEFFDSLPSLEEAKSYCSENRINCFYYCREINQEHEVCDSMMMPDNRNPPSGGFGER